MMKSILQKTLWRLWLSFGISVFLPLPSFAFNYEEMMQELMSEIGEKEGFSPEQSEEFLKFLEEEGFMEEPEEGFFEMPETRAPSPQATPKTEPVIEKTPDAETLFKTPVKEKKGEASPILITVELKDAYDRFINAFVDQLQTLLLNIRSPLFPSDQSKALLDSLADIENIEPSLRKMQNLDLMKDEKSFKEHPYFLEFFKDAYKELRIMLIDTTSVLKKLNEQCASRTSGEEVFREYDPVKKEFTSVVSRDQEVLIEQIKSCIDNNLKSIAQDLEDVLAQESVKRGIEKLQKKARDKEKEAQRRQKSYKGSYSSSYSGSSFGSWNDSGGWGGGFPSSTSYGGYGSYGGYSGPSYGTSSWGRSGYRSPWSSPYSPTSPQQTTSRQGVSQRQQPQREEQDHDEKEDVEKQKSKPIRTTKKKSTKELQRIYETIIDLVEEIDEELHKEAENDEENEGIIEGDLDADLSKKQEKITEEEKEKAQEERTVKLLQKTILSQLKDLVEKLVKVIKRAKKEKESIALRKDLQDSFEKKVTKIIPDLVMLARHEKKSPLQENEAKDMIPLLQREQAAAVQTIDLLQKLNLIKTFDSHLCKALYEEEKYYAERIETALEKAERSLSSKDLKDLENLSFYFLKAPCSLAYEELFKKESLDLQKYILKVKDIKSRMIELMRKAQREKDAMLSLLSSLSEIIARVEKDQIEEVLLHELIQHLEQLFKKEPSIKESFPELMTSHKKSEWIDAIEKMTQKTIHYLEGAKSLIRFWDPEIQIGEDIL